MPIFESQRPVLLSIDMQAAFDCPPWGASDNPDLHAKAARLLAGWRARGLSILHVRHDSLEPGSPLAAGAPGNRLRGGSEPVGSEQVVTKSENAAFVGTDLDLRLRRLGATELVVYGLQLDMCVSTTIRIGQRWDRGSSPEGAGGGGRQGRENRRRRRDRQAVYASRACRRAPTRHGPRLLGRGEALLSGLDLPSLGFRTVEHVATSRATHVVLAKEDG